MYIKLILHLKQNRYVYTYRSKDFDKVVQLDPWIHILVQRHCTKIMLPIHSNEHQQLPRNFQAHAEHHVDENCPCNLEIQ